MSDERKTERPSTTRRCFLRGAALGAAALVLAPGSRRAPASEDDRALPQGLPPAAVDRDRTADAPGTPVAIARCRSFDPQRLDPVFEDLFDKSGGLKSLVSGKTVTVKLNLAGDGRRRLGGRSAGRSFQTHPNTVEVLCGMLAKAGARRIVFVESYYRDRPPEEILQNQGWKTHRLRSAGDHRVSFEDTRGRGEFADYAKLSVPWGGYVYPAFHLNRRYADTDVFITLAKLKNHTNAGYTGSVKNLFGITPTSLYGDDAPNERSTGYRASQLHLGRSRAPAGVTPERHDGWNALPPEVCASWRVPRVTADIYGARPADLAIVEGIESCKGGEGFWIPGTRPAEPGVVIAGRNPVTVDSIGVAVLGFDPTAAPGTDVWPGDNHLALLARAGVGSHDPARIEVRGLSLKEALFEYRPGHRGWVKRQEET